MLCCRLNPNNQQFPIHIIKKMRDINSHGHFINE